MSLLESIKELLDPKKNEIKPIQAMPELQPLALNQLEALNVAAQAQITSCYIENDVTYIQAAAQVAVPVGFKIKDKGAHFISDVTIDQHTLSITGIESIRRTKVYISEYDRSLECNVSVMQLKLRGDLYYNQEMSGFEAVNKLQGLENVTFTGSGIVPLDVELGYCCVECLDNQSVTDYAITVASEPPFVIAPNGEKIEYTTRKSEFFKALEDGNHTKYIYITYTFIITPSPEPVS